MEKTLYPCLKLEHSMVFGPPVFRLLRGKRAFPYAPEVDEGRYDIAWLCIRWIEELMGGGSGNEETPTIVMPEKSTFSLRKSCPACF